VILPERNASGIRVAEGISVIVPDDPNDAVTIDPVTGDVETRHDNGEVTVDFGAAKKKAQDEDDFYRNLIDDSRLDKAKMEQYAEELLEGIDADDQSRLNHLENRARGLDYLGLELKDPKSTVSDGSNPVEGMSSVTNPLLLEAILKAWANSVGEFLPANGPVKISEDGDEVLQYRDDLAETLERDMNYFFTKGAPEYYPETSHMLLWGTHFGGSGFKKVYRCPIRRRPVSESVDEKDLIVSDTTKDLKACARITHRIFMRKSVMKRMMILGHYRDVALTDPTPTPNVVDNKEAAIQGTKAMPDRPEDQPYELYETQCELDIPEFAEKTQFAGEGLPLPYLVTIDKDSRKVLALRRDWNEEDEECHRRRMYVKWPYVPGPGFYGTGLLGMLGNSSAAMTAAWRMGLDAGMFASFPGGLITKEGTRQNSSMFRVAPGEFQPVDTGGKPIGQIAMPMPYRDATPGLMAMMERIETQSQRLGMSVEVPTQSGIQNVPVGTMLAHIEQATKIILATHQGMHTAQSEEFELIFDLFRAHPEDFFRSLPKNAKAFWSEEKFLQALEDVALTPRSDPNTPSHLHRIAMALGLAELTQSPVFLPMLNAQEILRRILLAMRVDPQGLVQAPSPQQAPPDLKGQAALITAEAKKQQVDVDAAGLQQKSDLEQQKAADQKQIEDIRLQREEVVHRGDIARAQQESQADLAAKAADIQMKQQAQQQDLGIEHAKFGLAVDAHQHKKTLSEQDQAHSQGLATDAQQHAQGIAEYQAANPPEKKGDKE
jgi:hypothetical protein